MAWARRGLVACLMVVALTSVLVALRWLPLDAGGADSRARREIVLVVRGMAFYLDGQFETVNPTLRFRAGERVRVVVRNEEPGVTHNFAVPAWKVKTRELHGGGADGVEFVVPAAPGRQDYQCTPHSTMMRGTIEIE